MVCNSNKYKKWIIHKKHQIKERYYIILVNGIFKIKKKIQVNFIYQKMIY